VDTGTLRGFPAIEYSQKVALISHLGDGAVEMIDDCSLSLSLSTLIFATKVKKGVANIGPGTGALRCAPILLLLVET